MTAIQILNAKEPGDLFTGDEAIMKSEYWSLAKEWHPDHHNNSTESNKVTVHLNLLYKRGLEMLKKGDWKRENFIKFIAKDGKMHEINYYAVHDFEFGKTFLCNTVVIYIIPLLYKHLFNNAVRVINGFQYAHDEMRKEFSRYVPTDITTFETNDEELGIVVHKSSDLLLLRDVLNHYNGQMPDRHVAWIISRLLNIVCYIEYNGITHNGISLDTFFISPPLHGGALLGGWWYSVPTGSKMIGTSQDILALMSPESQRNKISSIYTDLECVRSIGRELLGDKNGTRLLTMKAAPDPFIQWLRGTSLGNPKGTYKRWNEVLTESYGPRQFVALDITKEIIYNK